MGVGAGKESDLNDQNAGQDRQDQEDQEDHVKHMASPDGDRISMGRSLRVDEPSGICRLRRFGPAPRVIRDRLNDETLAGDWV